MGSVVSLPPRVAIYQAVRARRVDDVRAVIREAYNGYPVEGCFEWEDEVGNTALTIAARDGNAACVNLLLDLGADWRHSNRRPGGGTALHEAVESTILDLCIINSLLLKGANPFVENDYRRTPWEMAAARREPAICRKFEKENGLFAHHVEIRVNGDAALDKKRWVCILPRFVSSYHTSSKDSVKTTLYIFTSTQTLAPKKQIDVSTLQTPVVVRMPNGWKVFLAPLGKSKILGRSSTFTFVFENDRNGKKLMENFVDTIYQAQKAKSSFPESVDDCDILRTVTRSSESQNRGRIYSAESFPSFRSPSDAARRHLRDAEALRNRCLKRSLSSPPSKSVTQGKRKGHKIESNVKQSPPDVPTSIEDGHGNSGRCVVCLENPPCAGFVHGTSVHKCVCKDCAVNFYQAQTAKCPVCRQDIQHIVTDFF